MNENHAFSQLCFEPHHFRNMVARGTRTVKDSKVEPLLWGHRSPWACLNTCLDSVPCSPAVEQLGPAAPRSGGWSIFQLGSWLVGLGGSTGSHGGLIVNYPQATTRLLLWWCQIKESPCPLFASAAPSHLRKCSSPFSLHSDRIFKSWGNQKYIAECAPKIANCKAGRELVTHKHVAVLHHELHEGNSQLTTWWFLGQSEAATIASSPECLRSAGKPQKHFIFPWSVFILHFTHKYMGNLEPWKWMYSTSQCTVKNIYCCKV